MSIWFGYKALHGGAAIAEGPYDDVEKAMSARAKRKAIDMDVSPWFSAENREEADQIAKWHLEGAPYPNQPKN